MLRLWDSGATNSLPPATSLTGHMAKITHIPLPPLELLNYLLTLDPTSPSGLRWQNVKTKNQRKSGDIAGYCRPPNGYWFVGIRTDKARQYGAHRIVVYMQTGIDPGVLRVDHRIGLNNPVDVRSATASQNGANASKWKKQTTSTYKGVHWNTPTNKWRVKIGVNRKRIHLGYFANEKEAAIAYNKAAIEYFGEFAKINEVEE